MPLDPGRAIRRTEDELMVEHRVRVLGVKREALRAVERGDRHRGGVELPIEKAFRLVAGAHRRRAWLLGRRLHLVVCAAPLTVPGDVGDVVEQLRLWDPDRDRVEGAVRHGFLLAWLGPRHSIRSGDSEQTLRLI